MYDVHVRRTCMIV